MPDPPGGDLEAVARAVEAGTDGISVPEAMLTDAPSSSPGTLYARIVAMPVNERVKLALRGNKDARAILIRDANKLIRQMVLQNPRFSDAEAVAVCRNRSADEEALRVIAENRDWTRSYQVRLALATNPRTPIAVAVRMVPTLDERDVRRLARSHDVPEPVAVECRRRVLAKRPRGA